MLERADLRSLKEYNTFGIDVEAHEIIILRDAADLAEINNREEALILGGGSNVLFTKDLNKKVILNQTKGITEHFVSDSTVMLDIASGENWHETVLYAVGKGYGGIENLSLIPGSVGAAPMQNIGAYGVEIKDVLQSVTAVNLRNLETKIFTKAECQFGYRESIFKTTEKGKYFISKIQLKLTRTNHQLNTSYGAIKDVLSLNGIANPTIKDISEAVISIRKSKLPDPKELGNAGSFFKNPVIAKSHFDRLNEQFPDIIGYPIDNHSVKVPAGWLIESLGWKGKIVGRTGCHKNQALVLVNYGNASGKEIKELSERIIENVYSSYQIKLEREVNIIE